MPRRAWNEPAQLRSSDEIRRPLGNLSRNQIHSPNINEPSLDALIANQAIPRALPSGQRGPDDWFNKSAFTNPPATALGNAGVGVIEGPGWDNWNVALRKVFKLGENSARTLRFTAATVNTFNHVNLDNPNVSTNNHSIRPIGSSQPARHLQLCLT